MTDETLERERARLRDAMDEGPVVFVFGSNLAGIHGAGAARDAATEFGARQGQGVGRAGGSFAIPTKDARLETLKLEEIRCFVDYFLIYASDHLSETFFVTRVGCGLAGYSDAQIAPLFIDATPNCLLPEGWRVGSHA